MTWRLYSGNGNNLIISDNTIRLYDLSREKAQIPYQTKSRVSYATPRKVIDNDSGRNYK